LPSTNASILLPLVLSLMSTPLHASFEQTFVKISGSFAYSSVSIFSSYSPMMSSHLRGMESECGTTTQWNDDDVSAGAGAGAGRTEQKSISQSPCVKYLCLRSHPFFIFGGGKA